MSAADRLAAAAEALIASAPRPSAWRSGAAGPAPALASDVRVLPGPFAALQAALAEYRQEQSQ